MSKRTFQAWEWLLCGGKAFACIKTEDLVMHLLQMNEVWVDSINHAAFFLSLFILGIFYPAYKKCVDQLEKDDMIDQFLKD